LLKFISTSELVSITEKIAVCRDEKDNKFLELAVSSNANIIVTGDLDLLVLNPFQAIEIVTPDIFIDRFS
jgi:putative PIN family toxin of toxin-antitoxin system